MIWGYHYFRKPPYRKHHSPNKGRITRIQFNKSWTEAHRMMTRKKTGVMDLLTVSTKTEIRGTRSPEIRNRALSSLADHPISSLSLQAKCCKEHLQEKKSGFVIWKSNILKKTDHALMLSLFKKNTTRHWDIEPNQQRGRPSWSNWLTRSCSRLLLLLQTWQYPIPRHPPNPQKLSHHELVTGPEEGVWVGFCETQITMPQIYTSMVWHPPKRDIFGTRQLKCGKENHPTRPLQIRCGADTIKASIFCEFLGKIGGDAVMIISQANDGNVQKQPHIYQELPASEIAKSRCEQFIDLGNGTMRKKMILSSLGYETYSWGSEVLFGEIPLACWRQ